MLFTQHFAVVLVKIFRVTMTMMPTPRTESDDHEPDKGDVSKMPPRMTSVDDSVMLPEWYEPKEEDCICSWARQNHSHRKCY